MKWSKVLQHRGELVAEMAQAHGWTLGAELGTFDGSGTVKMLDGAPGLSLVTVDLFENQSPTLWDDPLQSENMREIGERARGNLRPYGGRCLLIRGDSHQVHTRFAPEAFDFVFVDANHAGWAVYRDLECWAPKVRPGGWVLGHDFSLDGVNEALTRFLDQRGAVCGRLICTLPDDCWGFEWCP